ECPDSAAAPRPGHRLLVGARRGRADPDAAAVGADAQVELPVLSVSDAFVEAVEGLEALTPVDAEVGRFGLLRLIAGMVGGTAEADRGHVGAGDGLLEGGPASGEHEPTAVRGLDLAQGVDGLLSVCGGELGVGVDADDDR